MRLLIFGRTGQVAAELRRAAGPDLEIVSLDRDAADLRDPQACADCVDAIPADAVINAAAFTAVDRAEAEEALAMVVNAEAPGAMARAAARRGAPFLHLSSDYVFDGAGARPWREDDPVGPLNAYGRTKLAGERAVAAAEGQHVILRVSWVHAGHGRNFVRSMLAAGAGRDRVRVVNDQRGGPTPAAAVAAALIAAARACAQGRGAGGTFHFSGAPTVSWAGFAAAIFDEERAQGRAAPTVDAIASADWPTPARRPLNGALDCASIAAAYGLAQPDWRATLPGIVAALRAESST